MRNLCLTTVAAVTVLAAGSAIGARAAPVDTENGAPVANALVQPAQWGGGFRDRDDFFFHRRFHRPFFNEFRPFHHRRFFFHRRFRDCDFDDPC